MLTTTKTTIIDNSHHTNNRLTGLIMYEQSTNTNTKKRNYHIYKDTNTCKLQLKPTVALRLSNNALYRYILRKIIYDIVNIDNIPLTNYKDVEILAYIDTLKKLLLTPEVIVGYTVTYQFDLYPANNLEYIQYELLNIDFQDYSIIQGFISNDNNMNRINIEISPSNYKSTTHYYMDVIMNDSVIVPFKDSIIDDEEFIMNKIIIKHKLK